ncbi:hypothetical protein BBAD15_g9502 [Beauveria bassiana D1-5]|uniref:Xylanolytic transcriptional activator regulatory domain-containing protein n=1 Tax=Beauveria bassiana D1-5 TaxID=1245745 RepID=A0A0A2VGK1_BEABA|nr:hypothetical protein BBAD15_g9502 [Beauveria bassiana D1-5]
MSALITPPEMEGPATVSVLPCSSPAQGLTSKRSPLTDRREVCSRRGSANLDCDTFGKDALLEAYYQNFHKFHPMVLPRLHLATFLDNLSWRPRLEPLLAVLRLLGTIYLRHEWSTSLQNDVESKMECLAKADPIRVQCHLLYSAALFWQDQKSKSQNEMGKAVEIALQLKMFERDFASTHSDQNPILAECWRRTWWMVYVFDAFYAGTLGSMGFSVVHVDATADLPCDEAQYESGILCWTAGFFFYRNQRSKSCYETVTLTSFYFKPITSYTCSVMIGFHRPLSDLKFNAVEDISSCARDPAPDGPTPEHINVHTVRVLRAVESQIRLLALPSRPFNHTPFCTCMISEGTLALLSACKFLLRGNELAIARDQIRLTIGCLKNLGALWPRVARNVSQIQTIAKHVLGIETHNSAADKGASASASGSAHSAASACGENESSCEMASLSNSDIFSTIQDFDDICGWYDIGELDPALPFWSANQEASVEKQ